MKRKISLGLIGILFWAFSHEPVQANEPLTLKECYRLALKRSETIGINEQLIKEAEGRFIESLSGVLPTLNFIVSRERLDRVSSSSTSSIDSSRFAFSQPLFSGFKEYAAIVGAKAQRKERENRLQRAKQLLFTDVSDAFYFLQRNGQDLQALRDIQRAFMDRLDELRHRQALGRSRDSEVASAEASLYKAQADEQSARSELEVARQLLEYLIGRPLTEIRDEPLPHDSVKSMEEFLANVEHRPDVAAARENLTVAQKNVTIARSGFWPSVNFSGNSYTERSNSSSDWDFIFSIDVPIFNGTQTWGQVKQARAQEKQAELLLSQTRRIAALDIQNAYMRFVTSQKIESALKKTFEAAEKNYQLQKADYTRSLVNKLEVLQSLQDLENTKRSYITAQNQTKRYYWNLKVASGDISHDVF